MSNDITIPASVAESYAEVLGNMQEWLAQEKTDAVNAVWNSFHLCTDEALKEGATHDQKAAPNHL